MEADSNRPWRFDRVTLEQLGLKPEEDYLVDRMEKMILRVKDGYLKNFPMEQYYEVTLVRSTGRTTRMLLRALGLVIQGRHVWVEAHSVDYTRQLRAQLWEWCRILELPSEFVLQYRPRNPKFDFHTLHDHYSGG